MDLENNDFINNFKQLCIWESLSRPVVVGCRFDSRILVSRRFLIVNDDNDDAEEAWTPQSECTSDCPDSQNPSPTSIGSTQKKSRSRLFNWSRTFSKSGVIEASGSKSPPLQIDKKTHTKDKKKSWLNKKDEQNPRNQIAIQSIAAGDPSQVQSVDCGDASSISEKKSKTSSLNDLVIATSGNPCNIMSPLTDSSQGKGKCETSSKSGMSVEQDEYSLEVSIVGIMHHSHLPNILQNRRVPSATPTGSRWPNDTMTPRAGQSEPFNLSESTDHTSTWLSRMHWLLASNAELHTNRDPSPQPVQTDVSNRPEESVMGSLSSHLLPWGYDTAKHHVFLASPIVSFKIRRRPRMDKKDYRAFPLVGYIPAWLPASYRSSDLQYEYLFVVSVVRRKDGKADSLWSIHYPMRVFGTSRNLIPCNDLLDLFISYSNPSKFILPPPPIFPPLPTTFASPSRLKLYQSMGGGVETVAREEPVMPMLLSCCEKEDSVITFTRQMDVVDPGYAYIKWAANIFTDYTNSLTSNIKTGETTEQGSEKSICFWSFVEPNEYRDFVKEFSCDPSNFLDSEAIETYLLDRSTSNNDNLSLRLPQSGSVLPAVPSSFRSQKIATLSEFFWMCRDWQQELKTNDFLCSCEPEWNTSKYDCPRIFNICVGTKYICEMSLLGSVGLKLEIENMLFSNVRDYSKSVLQAEPKPASRILLFMPEMLLFFNFSDSHYTVAQIQITVVALQTLLQPSLTAREASDWSFVRERHVNRGDSETISSNFSDCNSARRGSRQRMTTRTLIARKRTIVYERILNVLHQSQVPHKIVLPSDIPNSFQNELVTLTYQLEVEFHCVAHDGELLRLCGNSPAQTRTEVDGEPIKTRVELLVESPAPQSVSANPEQTRGTGIPFLVLNGPLSTKNVVKAMWSCSIVMLKQYDRCNLADNVKNESVVTQALVAEKADCNLRGQCVPRQPQAMLNFEY